MDETLDITISVIPNTTATTAPVFFDDPTDPSGVNFTRHLIIAWRVVTEGPDRNGIISTVVEPITVEGDAMTSRRNPWCYETPDGWVVAQDRTFRQFDYVRAWARDQLARTIR
jgi:hypothetical protein